MSPVAYLALFGFLVGGLCGWYAMKFLTDEPEESEREPYKPSIDEILVVLNEILRSVRYSPHEKICVAYTIKILEKLQEILSDDEEESQS